MKQVSIKIFHYIFGKYFDMLASFDFSISYMFSSEKSELQNTDNSYRTIDYGRRYKVLEDWNTRHHPDTFLFYGRSADETIPMNPLMMKPMNPLFNEGNLEFDLDIDYDNLPEIIR